MSKYLVFLTAYLMKRRLCLTMRIMLIIGEKLLYHIVNIKEWFYGEKAITMVYCRFNCV
jgi:hypothetical protein